MTRVVNIHYEEYDIYIGRGTKWGNPHHMRKRTKSEKERIINLYRTHLYESGLINDILELDGKVLGCHCKPGICHGDVLVEELLKAKQKIEDAK